MEREDQGRARAPRAIGDHCWFVRLVGPLLCLALGAVGDLTTHGDYAYAGVSAVWEHFSLFFAVDEIVVVLHADELMPSVFFGDVL